MRPFRVFWVAAFMVLGLLATGANAAEVYKVKFRLADWKTGHFHDTKKAEEFVGMSRKLGIEVKQSQHEGHTDIAYRCPQWRSLETKTDDLAHQWEKWLKSKGFETEHHD